MPRHTWTAEMSEELKTGYERLVASLPAGEASQPTLLFVLPANWPNARIRARDIVCNAKVLEPLLTFSPDSEPPVQWLGRALSKVDKACEWRLSRANSIRAITLHCLSEADKGCALYAQLRRLTRNSKSSRNAVLAGLKQMVKNKPKTNRENRSSSSSTSSNHQLQARPARRMIVLRRRDRNNLPSRRMCRPPMTTRW